MMYLKCILTWNKQQEGCCDRLSWFKLGIAGHHSEPDLLSLTCTPKLLAFQVGVHL